SPEPAFTAATKFLFLHGKWFDHYLRSAHAHQRNGAGHLDMQGRLLHLEAVPPQKDRPADTAGAPNWSSLLSLGGLDPSAYRSVPAEWTPLAWGDARAAWTDAVPAKA